MGTECVTEYKEDCEYQWEGHGPDKVCTNQPLQKCQDVPRQACQAIHKKVPVRVSRQVPKKVCRDGQSGHHNIVKEVTDVRTGILFDKHVESQDDNTIVFSN